MPDGAGPPAPTWRPLHGSFGLALTVDVEEWYHTCHVPEFVDPRRRPKLPEELDRLLPDLLELLGDHRAKATFFVLGEVADRLPSRIREIHAAGHEVASHGHLHLRATGRSPDAFRDDVARSKSRIEELLGVEVLGYRAPEWSLRSPEHPGLSALADLGFRYDSSLAPYLGAGRMSNPRWIGELRWPDGRSMIELPPLTMPWRFPVPASGWTGRIASPDLLAAAVTAHRRAGGVPVAVVHPWELSGRETPGELTGFGRFVHEFGRLTFRRTFEEILRSHRWTSISEAIAAVGETSESDTVPLPAVVGAGVE